MCSLLKSAAGTTGSALAVDVLGCPQCWTLTGTFSRVKTELPPPSFSRSTDITHHRPWRTGWTCSLSFIWGGGLALMLLRSCWSSQHLWRFTQPWTCFFIQGHTLTGLLKNLPQTEPLQHPVLVRCFNSSLQCCLTVNMLLSLTLDERVQKQAQTVLVLITFFHWFCFSKCNFRTCREMDCVLSLWRDSKNNDFSSFVFCRSVVWIIIGAKLRCEKLKRSKKKRLGDL